MRSAKAIALFLCLAAVGCGGPNSDLLIQPPSDGGTDGDGGVGGAKDDFDENPVLTPIDVLFTGEEPEEPLAALRLRKNATDPQFDLIATQSPVKSQGGRGVCSIFSTIGLMEHLYLKEGTYSSPDFSEQFLQWSAKVEVGDFPNTSGSSASSNLRALQRFGVVQENFWPYERSAWNSSDDPACNGGDNLPTKCHTNGNPPQQASSAKRWKVDSNRYLSTSTNAIKQHLADDETAVIVGMDFFFQSWNHGASELPIRRDYWRKGYVLYPNADDKRISGAKRVGHSILIVGWDDDLEVQKVDKDGELVVDGDGEPEMEKGFFLFKNSWGSDSFGSSNPKGAGYGWLSYRYVQEYGRARVSSLEEADQEAEICDDGADNDLDGPVDCFDADCADDPACNDDVEPPAGVLLDETGSVAKDEYAYHSLDVQAGDKLVVTVTPLDAGDPDLFLAMDRIPDDDDHDAAAFSFGEDFYEYEVPSTGTLHIAILGYRATDYRVVVKYDED